MSEQNIWGIHMSRDHGSAPIDKNYVAIGWRQMGDFSKIAQKREAFKAAYKANYPEAKLGKIPVAAGVAFRFTVEMKIGDIVVYPSKFDRMVNIGVVESDYRYVENAPFECPQMRSVKWLKQIPRESFSQPALNEIGSAITLFKVSTNAEEFLAALSGEQLTPEDIDEDSVDQISAQAEESTQDFIIKRLKNFQSSYQFEHFVAHLLKCMGYHSRVTEASGDGGIDIIAHKDELGFEPPIIKVQCKQTLNTIGRPEVQQLHGAIENGEHGLFVTLGAYANNARVFERGKPNLRLIDGSDLIDLIYQHYEKFEPRYQMLLPLKRFYIPKPLERGDD
jgi:restriction system protein